MDLGYKKVVVLAGYKNVNEALNNAEEFGDRDPSLLALKTNQEHGKEKKGEKNISVLFKQIVYSLICPVI